MKRSLLALAALLFSIAGACAYVTTAQPPFSPTPSYVYAAVSTASAAYALPSGSTVAFYNQGAIPVTVALGDATVTVTAGHADVIPPGGWLSFNVGSNTYFAVIGNGGYSTVVASGGDGAPSGGGGRQAPYSSIPVTGAQHGLSIASATHLTVPAGVAAATICARGADANYTTDGVTTPTSSVGTPMFQGACVYLPGSLLPTFIAIGAGATLDVEYFK